MLLLLLLLSLILILIGCVIYLSLKLKTGSISLSFVYGWDLVKLCDEIEWKWKDEKKALIFVDCLWFEGLAKCFVFYFLEEISLKLQNIIINKKSQFYCTYRISNIEYLLPNKNKNDKTRKINNNLYCVLNVSSSYFYLWQRRI